MDRGERYTNTIFRMERVMAENIMYLTVDKDNEKGGCIAVISMGSTQLGDKNITVLTVERVKNIKEAKIWYKRMKVEQPWIKRN